MFLQEDEEDTQRRGHMKEDTETREAQPQAVGHQAIPATAGNGKGTTNFSFGASRRTNTADTLM